MIENEEQMLAYLAADTRERAARNLYKYNDCGPWIEFNPKGIEIGSIVEGCDFGTTTYLLEYPFKSGLFERCIKAIGVEADALWEWANETDQETDAPDVELDYPELASYRNGRSA